MKTLFSTAAVVLLTATAVSAQFMSGEAMRGGSHSASLDQTMNVKGYLVDTRCAASHASNLLDMATAHPRVCTLRQGTSGLGVAAKGKWLPFDDKGVKKAFELLEKSTVEKGVMVSVTGKVMGDKFVVSRIKEVVKD